MKSKIDVPLPKGVHDRTGAVTFRVEQGNGEGVYASLMRWVEGEHAKENLTEEQIYKEGVLLAKLHKAAQELELPLALIVLFGMNIAFEKQCFV